MHPYVAPFAPLQHSQMLLAAMLQLLCSVQPVSLLGWCMYVGVRATLSPSSAPIPLRVVKLVHGALGKVGIHSLGGGVEGEGESGQYSPSPWAARRTYATGGSLARHAVPTRPPLARPAAEESPCMPCGSPFVRRRLPLYGLHVCAGSRGTCT
jgi:hypothetical protein